MHPSVQSSFANRAGGFSGLRHPLDISAVTPNYTLAGDFTDVEMISLPCQQQVLRAIDGVIPINVDRTYLESQGRTYVIDRLAQEFLGDGGFAC